MTEYYDKKLKEIMDNVAVKFEEMTEQEYLHLFNKAKAIVREDNNMYEEAGSFIVTKLKELYGEAYHSFKVREEDDCFNIFLYLKDNVDVTVEQMHKNRDILFDTDWYKSFKDKHPRFDFNVVEVFMDATPIEEVPRESIPCIPLDSDDYLKGKIYTEWGAYFIITEIKDGETTFCGPFTLGIKEVRPEWTFQKRVYITLSGIVVDNVYTPWSDRFKSAVNPLIEDCVGTPLPSFSDWRPDEF